MSISGELVEIDGGLPGDTSGGTAGRVAPGPLLEVELSEAARALEGATALEILSWATARFGEGLVLASSFQDCVLIDLAVQVRPDLRVVFLDTGFHFPETLAYLERVRVRYDLHLDVVRPEIGPDEWPCGTARCCELRKVAPLARALAGSSAWVTGVKRVDTSARSDAPVVAWDASKGLVKVNPIVAWTEDDVEAYVTERSLPRHPLTDAGYTSIGCAPTTRPVAVGEGLRAGRWSGTEKTECGLHL